MRKILTLLLVAVSVLGHGQTLNHPYYDIEKKTHFGFAAGLNMSGLKMSFSPAFYSETNIRSVRVVSFPFVSLQPVCNFHIKERLDLRFILNFSLTQRNLNFSYRSGSGVQKQVSSAYIGVPVLVKYKSVRHRNWRFYVIGGAEYAYDFESKQGNEQDIRDPEPAFVQHNYYYSYGAGFDLYYPFFKLSPEIRVANGLNNALASNTDAYTAQFERLRNRMVWFSFFFE